MRSSDGRSNRPSFGRASAEPQRGGAGSDRSAPETNGTRPVHSAIAAVFAQQLCLEVPAADTDLFDEGLIDSLALVHLIMALEQTFKVSIPLREIDLQRFRSIDAMAELLGELTARQKVAEFVFPRPA